MTAPFFRALGVGVASLTIAASLARADIELVREGRPQAVIVVSDQPTSVARYAAKELSYHIERASGARLPVVGESEAAQTPTRVYVGSTRAARAAGVDVGTLAPEAFVLKTTGNALIIAGGDAEGDPLDSGTYAGTMFGVYEWLERDIGVHWLWPGELGTQVPTAPTVRVREVNETVAPTFFQRNVRGGLSLKSKRSWLGFTPAASDEYAKQQRIFLRRHRVGRNLRISYHHAFTDWWSKYGAEHPEWFQLVKGKRGPTRPGGTYSMCVSNPEFRHKIIELWVEQRREHPDLHFLNAVENGIMGLCECENCRGWDGPTPENFLRYYPPKSKVMGSPFVTDRYVRFWLELQHAAEQIDPEATVIVYNYFNYFAPPTPGTKLNRHILVGSYPSAGWFPRAPDEHAWFKQQWTDWQQTGARLFSRGNYCLDGYTMPLVFAHQFADEFQHQARHGMEATDYDALTGQWSTQGPNLYLLMRLQTRPTADPDELLEEYYGAFGAAAPNVKAYFDYWEQYALAHRAEINREYEDNTSRWRAFAVAAHRVFPADSFVPAKRLLAQAVAAARGDPVATERVAFLQAGLTHAQLCTRVSQWLNVRDATPDLQRGRAALAELVAFRRAHEREWLSNFNHSAWTEDASWRLPDSAPTP